MHPDQLSVSSSTVRALVDAQFPAWRALPISPVTSHGTVNAIYRIGDRFAARFPLQGTDVADAWHTARAGADAAAELAGRTRFRTPEPVALGEPGPGYPLPWSVQTWLPGTPATGSGTSAASAALAGDLAEFIHGVRAIGARGRTFDGQGRGGVLRDHDEWVRFCLARSDGLLDVPRLRRVWERLRELPRGGDPDVLSHGDLMPGNLLVEDGRLTGVIDVGGLAAADPALDLLCAWDALDTDPRQVLRAALGCDDLTWQRGMAWAFEQAMGLVWYYRASNPVMSETGRRTLDRILADQA